MVSSLSRHILLEGPEEINSEIEVKGKPPPTDKDFGKYLCVWFFKYLFFLDESALPHALKKTDATCLKLAVESNLYSLNYC